MCETYLEYYAENDENSGRDHEYNCSKHDITKDDKCLKALISSCSKFKLFETTAMTCNHLRFNL